MSRIIARVPLGAVPLGCMTRLAHPPFDILVAHTAEGIFAIEDACPHSGASLARGHLDGNCVVCPAHEWRIALKSGEVLTEAGRGRRNDTYEVSREGNEWLIRRRSSP